MEKIMEILRKMQAEFEATPPEMKLELRAKCEAVTHQVWAKWDSHVGEGTDACEGVTHAYLEEEKEPTPEKTEAVEKPQEVPDRETDTETSGGIEDRTGEQRLAVRRHRQRKKRAQGNGGPRQKFAAFRGGFTRHAIPALRKGHVRKRPGKRYRRRSIRGQGKAPRNGKRGRIVKKDQQPAVGYRNPLKRQTKNNVVRETPEGRTCEKRRRTHPECNSSIR
jgi:hypothetical protein